MIHITKLVWSAARAEIALLAVQPGDVSVDDMERMRDLICASIDQLAEVVGIQCAVYMVQRERQRIIVSRN